MRQRDGQPNGDKYIGAWLNGQKHGLGIFYDSATGDKKQGEWKEADELELAQVEEHDDAGKKLEDTAPAKAVVATVRKRMD